MVVVDTATGDAEISVGLSTSPPSSTSSIPDTSSSSIASSTSSVANDQDQSIDHDHNPPPPSLSNTLQGHRQSNSTAGDDDVDAEEAREYERNIRELEDLFSKLNPMAKEFVPPSLSNNQYDPTKVNANAKNNHLLTATLATLHAFNPIFYRDNANNDNSTVMVFDVTKNDNLNGTARKKKNFGQAKRRMNTRTSMAQREEIIRRTVYVTDIDQQVTEEQLAALFVACGQVVDCRICGDPNSMLRFAFIEFTNEDGAVAALNLSGTLLGFYPVRVLPSKTAIAPVNPTFLPRNDDEREMCTRTIYCTNIDKKVTQADVKLFFESTCGEVYRLRLLGDYHHSTRIAFVEFVQAESAIVALNCSGVVLGALPIRVSPSKTPVRPRSPRMCP
ncbi:unnamed protein product [Linum trigynum]|uniref:RRM domain-containing protein n=1 Tax=Linum trigynum TaxID=586398 RepID=A0AAV2DJ95_9ROSI